MEDIEPGTAEYIEFCRENPREHVVTNVPEYYGINADDARNIRKRYIRQRLMYYKELRSHLVKIRLKSSRDSHWLVDIYMEEADNKIDKVEREMRYLQSIGKKGYESKDFVPLDVMKERVKVKQVLDLFGIPLVNGKFFKIRNENTPSACINTEKNLWYDFGSSQGGSCIDLYMCINNCDFSTAFREMKKVFYGRY